jgi:hypothetical protein
MPKYLCECCKFITNKKNDYDEHMISEKHIMRDITKDFFSKIRNKFENNIERIFFNYITGADITEEKDILSFNSIPEKLIDETIDEFKGDNPDTTPVNTVINTQTTCEFCNKSFVSIHNLTKHKTKCKHKDKPSSDKIIKPHEENTTILIYNADKERTCTIDGTHYRIHRIIEVIEPLHSSKGE